MVIGDALIRAIAKRGSNPLAYPRGSRAGSAALLLNFDVSLPIARSASFAEDCGTALRAKFPEAHVSFFGHVATATFTSPFAFQAQTEDTAHAIDAVVYGLVRHL